MNNQQTQQIYQQLMQIVQFFNDPKQDQQLLASGNIELDFKLFPLFMSISYKQPTTVGELADFLGKSHSTISRQIDRLEKTGWVQTTSGTDTRTREIQISTTGKELLDKISTTRHQHMARAFSDWSDAELAQLQTTMLKLMETLHKNHDLPEV